jgi:hypothetical protein
VPIVDAFFVSKSENRNQVHYAVAVDARCAPSGASPAIARWKMFEKGPTIEEPLLDREQRAYGIASQTILFRTDTGGRVRIVLRALPSRPVIVETFAQDGVCRAVARMQIRDATVRLFNVHLALSWPVGLDHLVLQGWSDDGRIVRENLEP